MPGFVASAGPCSVHSKLGLRSEGTLDARLSALRLPAASSGLTDIPRKGRPPASSERMPGTRWPSSWNRNHADDDSIQLEPARPCGGDRTLEMGGVLSRYANLR